MEIANREQWLNDRRKGIGGSDIAALVGMSKYNTPYDIWRSKVLGESTPENDFMRVGNILEPFIAKWYAEDRNMRFTSNKTRLKRGVYPSEQAISKSTKSDIFLASTDYLVNNDSLLECKSTRTAIDRVMDDHFCQVQWYLDVVDFEYGDIAYVILPFDFNYTEFIKRYGNVRMFHGSQGGMMSLDLLKSTLKMEVFRIYRDQEFIGFMQDIASEFWRNHVLTKIPPPPSSEKDIKAMYPSSVRGKRVLLNDITFKLYEKAKKLSESISEKTKQLERYKEQVKLLLRDAESAYYLDKEVITYKTSKDKECFDLERFKLDFPELYEEYTVSKDGVRKLFIK